MTSTATTSLLLGALLVASAACGSSSNGNTGGAGGTSEVGGAGGSDGGGGPGAGGSMKIFHPGVLVDRGLVARYYLDEAADGQMPTAALDAAPDPLDLPLTYLDDAEGEHMTYVEDAAGNRGLAFDAIERDDRASAPIDGTKVRDMIEGGMEVTFEVVAELEAVSPSVTRLLHIGFDTDHTLSFETASITRIAASVNDADAGMATVYHPDIGRAAFHMVVDLSQSVPEDRTKLYVDGGHYPNVQNVFAVQGVPLTIGDMRHLVIGNREIGGRTPQGVIYYAAIYNVALTDAEVAQNAELLLQDDDSPSATTAP